MKKDKGERVTKEKKGEVVMQIVMHEKVTALRERALQRRDSFPVQKDEKSIEVEEDLFEEMKDEMYRQIAEDKKWN
ncbi:MAG: hypothetical protein OSJ72_17295 [Lachnospiraceae bacterium]|nr:hypothetical protein [Lachnospiraceae bacterium]